MVDLFLADVVGHIGYAFIALGIMALSKKKKWGWISRFIGEALWIGIGFYVGMSSMWAWGFVFLVIDGYGYYKWRRDERLPVRQH